MIAVLKIYQISQLITSAFLRNQKKLIKTNQTVYYMNKTVHDNHVFFQKQNLIMYVLSKTTEKRYYFLFL